jgi:nicotinamidase-related amidase
MLLADRVNLLSLLVTAKTLTKILDLSNNLPSACIMKRKNFILGAGSCISTLAVYKASAAIPEQFRVIQQQIQKRVQQGPHTKIEPQNSALLLIEFQGEWLSPKGRLRPLLQDSQQFESALRNAKLALQAARKSGMNVIHAGMQFQPGHPEIAGGYYGLRGLQPITNVFVANTLGSQFMAPFTPLQGEFVPTGRTGASAFTGSNLDEYLRGKGITTLYLMGFASNICVESTMRDAHDRGYHTIVLGDATATFTREQQQNFLKDSIHHFAYKMQVADYVKSTNAATK